AEGVERRDHLRGTDLGGQLERPARPVEGELHGGVDVGALRDALAEREMRLVHELAMEASEHEAGRADRYTLHVPALGVAARLRVELRVGWELDQRAVRVLRAMRAIVVAVPAASRLAAEPPGVDEARLERTGSPARLVEALLPERLRDLEVDVNPDQIHELERSHAKAAADPDDAIDLIEGHPLRDELQRLERERPHAAVGDEADAVGDADRCPAHPLGGCLAARQGALAP